MRRNQRQLTQQQQQEIKEAFSLFDTDKDNHIDYHELKVSLRALGFDVKKQDVLKIIRDNSDNSLLSFDSFNKIASSMILDRDPISEIKRAFSLFDSDSKGKICLKDLRRVAKEIGESIDDNELQAMIDEFDLDNDGEINESEFIQIMTEGE